MAADLPIWENVLVEIDDGIAWVSLNRPAKRNAMNPALNAEMVEVLDVLESDDRAQVVVLTGVGESFSAGMDLQEYFRDVDAAHPSVQIKVRRTAAEWQWRHLSQYTKPTIAMVNGWCFGGAFSPLVGCDLAIAAEDAVFGLSEINWGIPPGSVVSRALAETHRPPGRALVHHDRGDVRRSARGRDGPGQQGGPATISSGPRSRAWPTP